MALVPTTPTPKPTLVVFLPGTGTAPHAVRQLLSAAADMGLYALALGYSSLPVAVSHADIWCTRTGADPAACNVAMHEAVVYGSPRSGGAAAEDGGLWEVPRNESVEVRLVAALHALGWDAFLEGASVAWPRIVLSGHSQGASHAAWLSTVVAAKAAVLLSGPQESADVGALWVGTAPPMLRRAAYALHEECGDVPDANPNNYCARSPQLLRTNLVAMGLEPALLGKGSGFVVADFPPPQHDVGRAHHDSMALDRQAVPALASLWRVLFAELGD
jgi:hypothetical protein